MTKIGYWILAIVMLGAGLGAALIVPRGLSEKPVPMAEVKPAEKPTPPQAQVAAKQEPKDVLPEFDIVRVEPSGELVVAGRAAPNALIVLMRGDTQHGTANADSEGRFAMVPHALPPGSHELRLVATDRQGVKSSKQSVFVSVPQDSKGETVVALQAPGVPTVNMQPVAQKQGERAKVRIFAVDILTTGVMAASGSAEPGAEIRLYLNDTLIVSAKAAANGAWSLTVEKGVTPGLYRLRADDVAPDGKILSRAEIQFDVPSIQAAAPTNKVVATASPSPASPSPASTSIASASTASASNVVVPSVQTATVARGDSLWRLSEKIYGHGMRFTIIHGANTAQIRDPDLIYPGQVFVLPPKTP